MTVPKMAQGCGRTLAMISAIFLVLSGIVIVVIALVHMNMVPDAIDELCDLQNSMQECFGMCGQVVVGAKRRCAIVWVVET